MPTQSAVTSSWCRRRATVRSGRFPPLSRSVSPDNIIRSWFAPLDPSRTDEILGLYGYNEQAIFRPGHYEMRRTKIRAFSPGPGRVEGLVKYAGKAVHGALVTIACHSTHANADGFYSGVEVTAKRAEPVPGDPYPIDIHVRSILGAKGIASWPITPDATNEFDVHLATDAVSPLWSIDLKTGGIAPVRAHLEMVFANHRQG